MTSIPPRDRALLDHAESIRSLVSDNHQLRCERDAAQRAQWHQQEEIERLRKALEEACGIAERALGDNRWPMTGHRERVAELRTLATQKDGSP